MNNEEVEVKVLQYLEELKNNGIIMDFGFNEYRYWQNILYIKLFDENCIYLAEYDVKNHTSTIKTIFEYSTFDSAKKAIDTVINVSKEIFLENITQAVNYNLNY